MQKVINPANGRLVKEYPELTNLELEEILQKVNASFLIWSQTSFSERSACIRKLSKLLLSSIEKYSTLMTIEMGKPIKESHAEIKKCASVCDYFAQHAEQFLKPESIQTEFKKSEVVFDPLGVVLGIMPWNFPFWQVFRFLVPTLMAGNGIVLKHASNVPGSALAIENLIREAGFPDHLFRTLLVSTDQIKNVIEDPRIQAVTLTGSEKTGSIVASQAGKVLKKTCVGTRRIRSIYCTRRR